MRLCIFYNEFFMPLEKAKFVLSTESSKEKPIESLFLRILRVIKSKIERILEEDEQVRNMHILERKPCLADWDLAEIDFYIDKFKALSKEERKGVLLYLVGKEELKPENSGIHDMANVFQYLFSTLLDSQIFDKEEWRSVEKEKSSMELVNWLLEKVEMSVLDVSQKHSPQEIANLLYFSNKVKKEALNFEFIYHDFYNEKLKRSNSVMFEYNGDGNEGKIIKLGEDGSFKSFFGDKYKRFGNISNFGVDLKNPKFLEAKEIALQKRMREVNVDGYLFRFQFGSRAYSFAMKLTFLGPNPYNQKPLFSIKFQDVTDAQNKAELFEQSDTPQAIVNSDGSLSNFLNDLNAEFRRIFAEKLDQDVKNNNVYAILGLNEEEIGLIKKKKQFNKIISVGDRFYEFILKQEYSMVYVSSHDVTELNNQATIDPLTKTLNRRTIFQELQKTIERSKREKSSLSVIMLDLDHFKKINDQYGHGAGDIVLEKVAKALTENLRQTDQIGRYGGEEFLIILPNASLKNAFKKGDELRSKIEKMEIPLSEELSIKLTISLGVAEKVFTKSDFQKTEKTSKENDQNCLKNLVEEADEALFLAKRNRNTCRCVSSKSIECQN